MTMPLVDLAMSSFILCSNVRRERILKNSRKTGTRQYTRVVWSTFAKIRSRYKPCFIDALFGVTGISG